MKFTVFGSSGYLGSSLVRKFKSEKIECLTPDIRKDKIEDKDLGHIIYAIGVSNFKQNPSKAIDAHVILPNKLLNEVKFESFLYLRWTYFHHRFLLF